MLLREPFKVREGHGLPTRTVSINSFLFSFARAVFDSMEKAKAADLLRSMLGPAAEFREGQWDAIDWAANQRQRVLVVQRTGWGKSVVYFLATKLLREAGLGPTLLISPLLALMRNQILAAQKLGVRAVAIHGENIQEWEKVEAALASNEADLLMVSPERLGNAAFLKRLLPVVQQRLGMFVVDEAHCISDWGHDFRPDYRRIVRVLQLLPETTPVLCTTATANDRVVNDIEAQIPRLRILRGPLVNPSLQLFNVRLENQADRLAWLAQFLPKLPGSGIIYTLTIQDSRRVSAWLQSRGILSLPYHSDLEAAERVNAEQKLLANQVKTLVATVALGMGFDKPDLGFVIHFQRPGSVVAYYQQVGRAGRAVSSAYGILLSGREDDEIQEYFIRTAFPSAEVMDRVLHGLSKSDGMSVEALAVELNFTHGTMEKALKLLEVDGAVECEQRQYYRTENRWDAQMMRSEQVARHRRDELAQIKRYVEHEGCLMEFLARALDDPAAAACGKCMNCAGRKERKQPQTELVQAAAEFLRGDTVTLEPRTRWPQPVLEDIWKALPEAVERFENGRLKTVIPEALRAEEGRVLCLYGDAGWGQEVARGRYGAGSFNDDLVRAAAELIREKWKPDPRPAWVTAIPSRRHRELVQGFAERLATALNLPFLPVLDKRGKRPEQKEMQNSAMQLRNLLGAFAVVSAEADLVKPSGPLEKIAARAAQTISSVLGARMVLPPGPVLLVDDVVDSRWTMTLASVLLRQHGSGPVFPFALARASLRGS